MWEQVGRQMGAYVLDKERIQQDIETARREYWAAALTGEPPRELEERYFKALWERDFHTLGIEWINHIAGGIGGPDKAELGTLMDSLSTLFSGGRGQLEEVHRFCTGSFEGWVGHLKNLWPKHDFDFPATLVAGRESYAEYVECRSLAEYLFRNPNTPLGSDDPRQFVTGWLLATRAQDDIAAALDQVEAMHRLVGEDAFGRAAEAARAQRLVPETEPRGPYDPSRVIARGRRPQALDWVATRHDPTLYAIYLIRRATKAPWPWAEAAHRARLERHGTQAHDAVARAFAAADDPQAECVGDPVLQDRKTTFLLDCVTLELGPITLWADALEIARGDLDAEAQRRRLLEALGKVGSGDASERYRKLVGVIDEPVLLAALAHQSEHGIPRLLAGRGRDSDWQPFEEELRTFELFAAADDPRGLALALIAQGEEADHPLRRLELALDTYRTQADELGEAKLVEAARRVAAAASPDRGLGGYLSTWRREIGEGGQVDTEMARQIQQRHIEAMEERLGSSFRSMPFDSALKEHFRRQGSTMAQAQEQVEAVAERVEDAFREAVENARQPSSEGPAGGAARAILGREIDFAQQLYSDQLAKSGFTLEDVGQGTLEDEVFAILDRLQSDPTGLIFWLTSQGREDEISATLDAATSTVAPAPAANQSASRDPRAGALAATATSPATATKTKSARSSSPIVESPTERSEKAATTIPGRQRQRAIVPRDIAPPESGSATPPAADGAPALAFGESRAGTVTGGEANRYRLEVTAPSLVFFDVLSASARARYRLVDPTGGTVFTSDGSDEGPLSLEPTGTYQLVVETLEGRPVEYALRMVKIR